MFELQGKYNTAKVFTDSCESSSQQQIIHLLNQPFIDGSKVRIMPDVHAGAGCTIGTTMTITDKVVPNLVGVDIGCGMLTVKLKEVRVDFTQLDKTIRAKIPAGFEVRDTAHKLANEIDLSSMRIAHHVKLDRAYQSIGTLGGGNHFIELDKDEETDELYLVIHSGSRHLGVETASYYQNKAADTLIHNKNEEIIAELKAQGREKDIQSTLSALKASADRVLSYCEGELLSDYLHDMKIAQHFAELNREAIAREIIKAMKWHEEDSFQTVHNYIDLESNILRKGAVSAKQGERLLIPINMRDGSLLCVGKGNDDWNQSAPHGAGRLMSRSAAKRAHTVREFKQAMKGIFSTSVNESTLDEAPFAYKTAESITAFIGDTVEIEKTIKPVYNFKAGSED